MTASYTAPDKPADPEAATLELIVRLPGEVMEPGCPEQLTETLQEYVGVLDIEGAFHGMCWRDAEAVASAVAFDAVMRDDARDFLSNRARKALAGTDNMPWQDRHAAARAMPIAAPALGL